MIKYKMDELTIYLKFTNYKKFELEQILNKKIIITNDHINGINVDYCFNNYRVNMIKLFNKYGFIFTDDIYISLVNKNGYILFNIPKNDRTNEICKTAVQQNGYALAYVPYDKKTDEICKIAVRQQGLALQFVPDDKKTDEICEIAVKQNKEALKYVPHNKKHLFIKNENNNI